MVCFRTPTPRHSLGHRSISVDRASPARPERRGVRETASFSSHREALLGQQVAVSARDFHSPVAGLDGLPAVGTKPISRVGANREPHGLPPRASVIPAMQHCASARGPDTCVEDEWPRRDGVVHTLAAPVAVVRREAPTQVSGDQGDSSRHRRCRETASDAPIVGKRCGLRRRWRYGRGGPGRRCVLSRRHDVRGGCRRVARRPWPQHEHHSQEKDNGHRHPHDPVRTARCHWSAGYRVGRDRQRWRGNGRRRDGQRGRDLRRVRGARRALRSRRGRSDRWRFGNGLWFDFGVPFRRERCQGINRHPTRAAKTFEVLAAGDDHRVPGRKRRRRNGDRSAIERLGVAQIPRLFGDDGEVVEGVGQIRMERDPAFLPECGSRFSITHPPTRSRPPWRPAPPARASHARRDDQT
jgi:hypothetical protein